MGASSTDKPRRSLVTQLLALTLLAGASLAQAEPSEPLSEERIAALVELLADEDLERRESAERILTARVPERIAELAESPELDAHVRWRLGRIATALETGELPAGRKETQILDPGQPPIIEPRSVRDLLLELEAGRRYSTDAPAFLALIDLGPDAVDEMLDAMADPSISSTLRYYALQAYQKVAVRERMGEELAAMLAVADEQMTRNIGMAFRQSGLPPDAVLELASVQDPSRRRQALLAMSMMSFSQFGDEAGKRDRVGEALFVAVEDPVYEVAVTALEALSSFVRNGPIDPRLLAAARSPDVEVAAAAMALLRNVRGSELLDVAVERARDSSKVLRGRAYVLLGALAQREPAEFQERGLLELLIEGSRDQDTAVRIAAWEALGTTGMGREVGPMLRERLLAREQLKLEPREQAALARALGNLGDEDSISVLLELIATGSESSDDDAIGAESLMNAAIGALRTLAYRASPDAKEQITQAFLSVIDSPVRNLRFQAAQYLANAGEESLLDQLETLIEDVDVGVRSVVASGLSRMRGNDRAAEILIKALQQDPEPSLRRNAASILAMVGVKSEAVAGALREALADVDGDVRLTAAQTMNRLGLPGAEEMEITQLQVQVEASPSYSNLVQLRDALSRQGRHREALPIAERAAAMVPPHMPPGYELVAVARVSLAAEERDKALDSLEAAIAAGYRTPERLRLDGAFKDLMDDERFQALTGGER